MIRSLNRQRFRGVGVFRRVGPLGWAWATALLTWSEPSVAQGDEDPWWGRDKALHFGVSTGLAATGYGVSSLWLERAWQRATAGAAFSLTLGVGKELADWAGYGQPSYKDLLYDFAGTALGVTLAYLVDLATGTNSEPERAGVQGQGLGQVRPLISF